MPATRKKSKKDEEGFYISTDPSPKHKTPLPEKLTSDEHTENAEVNNIGERSTQHSEGDNSLVAENSPSIHSSADHNSSSDEVSTNHNTMKDIESINLKKEKIQNFEENISSPKLKNKRTIEYSAVVEKSLEQFLFGKAAIKQANKRKSVSYTPLTLPPKA